MNNSIVEKITSSFDTCSDTTNDTKFNEKIKNEVIIFLIDKEIVNSNNLYYYSICREYSYNDNPEEILFKYVIICKDSGVKFINESLIDYNGNDIYKTMDVYKYFQAPNKDFDKISERKLNFYNDNNRRFNNIKHYLKDKIYLDFACGYGGIIDKCSNLCKDIIGIEIMESALNLLKNKYDYNFYNNIDIIQNNTVDIITIFQSLELLSDPIGNLNKFYKKLKLGGILIIETSNANKALYTLYNNDAYKKFITSLRKVIYSENAIVCLLTNIGFKNINVEHQQRYNISNHLGWLSHNNPGNDIITMDNDELNDMYKNTLINCKKSDTLFIICEK
tara:strand:- start:9097 stop:10098 length:1002 start_codon:yes stop_codon:yes gene_type:complete